MTTPPQATVTHSSRPRAASRLASRNALVQIVQTSRPVLGPDQRKLPALVGISFVMGLLEAGLVLLVVQMAVALAGGKEEFGLDLGPFSTDGIPLLTGVGIGMVLVLLLVACLMPVSWMAGFLASRAQLRTRERLLGAYLRASWQVRSRYPEGHLQELLTTYTHRAERAVTQLVIASVATCGLVAILLTSFVTSPLIAGLAILAVAGVGGLLRPLIKATRTASEAYAVADRAFASRTAEISRLTPEITAFDVTVPVEEAVGRRSEEVAGSLRRIRGLARLVASLYQYIALFLIVAAIGAISLLADAERLAVLGAVLLLLVRALAYGQQLQTQVQANNETAPFIDAMEQELATLSAAAVDRSGVSIDEPAPLAFEDVRFAYEPGVEVLRGISFEVRPGESLGIIGRSGAGKSTLVHLVLRLHHPTGGRLTTGGVPLSEVSLQRWAELVAYVPQDNKLISGTVADNIRFFRHHLDDEVVREAARRAHLLAEIEALPEGFATPIGTGVRELSGGQRQRLGIARALAGDPRLIILDEPTSSLDARSEDLIAQTLADLRGNVTTIIVAHRAATTAICDRILSIEDGDAKPVSASRASEALTDRATG